MKAPELQVATSIDEVRQLGIESCRSQLPGFIIKEGIGTIAVLDTLERVMQTEMHAHVPFTDFVETRLEPESLEGSINVGLHVDLGYRGFAVHNTLAGPVTDVYLGFTLVRPTVNFLTENQVEQLHHGQTYPGRQVVFLEDNVTDPFDSKHTLGHTAHNFVRPEEPTRHHRYTAHAGDLTDFDSDQLEQKRLEFRTKLAEHGIS